MNSKQIRKMVTTAIIIALAVVFQSLRYVMGGSNPVSTYVISTLVNLCLIVAVGIVGLWSGVSVALLTPLIALLQGHTQIPMVWWVMAGNTVLVLCYALLAGKGSGHAWMRWSVAGLLAAVLKYTVIFMGQATVLSSVKGLAFQAAMGTAAGMQVQQLITAVIAMILAKLVISALPDSVKI